MAVIDNRSTEDGDVLIIKPEVPIIGLLSLYQFVDTTTNESLTDYFRKEFRYSVDGGLTFGDWTELTLLNIEDVLITKYDQFVIEYRYTRVGDTSDVTLTFEDILVSGDIDMPLYPTYQKTPFKDFFEVNDINVFGWAINVLEKLYRKGSILPDYVQRADNDSNLEDEDFIVYWNSITHFFALLVYFARQYEDFATNETLLIEFFSNRDLTIESDAPIEDIIYLYENHIEEYKKRGTQQIIERKSDGADINGELLRLIEFNDEDEFMFAKIRNGETGWCLGMSSPMWKGTERIINLYKGYEFTKDVQAKASIPLVEPTYVTGPTNGYLIIDEVPASTVCGVDYDGTTAFKLKVSSDEDYEISFRVKQESLEDILSFGVRAYNSGGTEIGVDYFFENVAMKIVDTEYWVRGILWNSSKANPLLSTNIAEGTNLKMTSQVTYIVPVITVSDAAPITTKTYLRDIKVHPLKLNFTQGQLGVHTIYYMLCKINNMHYSEDEINDIIENKLVPYKTFVKIKNL